MDDKKKKLGQFYTTNYDYILKNFTIPNYVKTIIEPFAGNCDLLNFIKNKKLYSIELYDIDPKTNNTIKQDTLLNPPSYENKFLLTNPPYLARNKSNNKDIFDKYNQNDLYKCVLKELCTNKALGGIIIIPLNFWSSIRLNDINLRKDFLKVYDIICVNIFEEQVFTDTSYTVCAFQFELKNNNNNNNNNSNSFNIHIYPSERIINVDLNDANNYIIGGEIYNLKNNNNYKITRCTNANKDKLNTNILAKCIDDNSKSKINLSFVDKKDLYIDSTPNQTARTYASLIIEPSIDIDKQKLLINKFNNYLELNRNKYNSLFLTNYRESKDIARKRISFDLIYNICYMILDQIDDENDTPSKKTTKNIIKKDTKKDDIDDEKPKKKDKKKVDKKEDKDKEEEQEQEEDNQNNAIEIEDKKPKKKVKSKSTSTSKSK